MELARFPLRGGYSVQSILTSVITVFLAVFLWAIFSSTPVQAQAQASWNGETIMFDTRQYTAVDRASLQGAEGIPADAKVYIYRDGEDVPAADRKAYIIYFTAGVDPPKAENAVAVVYSLSASGELSNAQNQRDITIAPAGTEGSYSSCTVEGVGWIICPITVFLADSMDFVYKAITNFIEVPPLLIGGDNNDLYRVWEIMRNLANIAFAIAFLFIIYSQLTNIQINNYGLKKLLPRLIIAAILVNISYIIVALAVDLSNILGHSIHQIFIDLRQDVFNVDNQTFDPEFINWPTVATAVLGGAGLAYFSVGSLTGMVYILVPLLIGLALTALFVLIVLAARQAIIIILVIVAPLAFVAYILPNTEKWFDRWQDILTTMLIFFPAFSLVFGGSQLAGQIIIQNAGSNFLMVVLGLAVQVAPLVITPMLLKFSGNLLGRIAQIVNNPRKGVMDRANNWKDARVDMKRQQNLSKDTGFNPGRALLKRLDSNQQHVKRRTAMYRQMADNNYEKSDRYKQLNLKEKAVEHDKEKIHADHAAHADRARRTPGSVIYDSAMSAEAAKETAQAEQNRTGAFYNRARSDKAWATSRKIASGALYASNLDLEGSKSVAERSKANLDTFVANERSRPGGALRTVTIEAEQAKQKHEIADAQLTKMVTEFKSGKITKDITEPERVIMKDMKYDSIKLSAEKQGATAAQYEIQRNIADVMTGRGPLTEQMLEIAQGVGGEGARVRAISQAVSQSRGLMDEALKSNVQLLRDEAQRKGTNIKYYSKDMVERWADGHEVMTDGSLITPERLKAALQAQAEEKNIPLFERVRRSSRFDQKGMVNEIISLNNTNFKIAGAFAMQDDLSHNIENYKAEELDDIMSLDRISNLANANASGLSSWKMGQVVKMAEPETLKADLSAAMRTIQMGEQPGATADQRRAASATRANLQTAYGTVREALENPDIRADIKDREIYVRRIEAALARMFGRDPLPDQPMELAVDPRTIDTIIESEPVFQEDAPQPPNNEDVPYEENTPPEPTTGPDDYSSDSGYTGNDSFDNGDTPTDDTDDTNDR